jgi:Holliday junction resolvase RusA-like endonuclease
VFTFARPRSHYRTGRNAHLVRDSAPARPAVYPDASKALRAVEDSLVDAGVIRDDCRLVEFTRLAKVYAGEDPEALHVPGAVITVRQLEAAVSP